MLKRVTILMLVVYLASTFEDQPYCSIRYRRLCQGKGRHVACQFPNLGAGPSCENYTQIKFTTHLKHFITSYINRRRQRIAAGNERVRGGVHLPRPQVMMLVEWDRELAFLAQRLADQCYFVHDDCRATVRYPYAGQTVGEVRWRRSSDSDELSAQRAMRRVFDAWWGERRRVYAKQLTSPFRFTKGAVWGHFSQLAVWTLSAAGCGAVRHGRSHARLLIVCDFSHTNMLGQRTLPPGPLAPCPIHTVRRPRSAYPLLCAPVRYQKSLDPEDRNEYEEEEETDPDDTIDVDEVQPPTNLLEETERTPAWKTHHSDTIMESSDEDDDVQFRPVSKITQRQQTRRMQVKTYPRTEPAESTEKDKDPESARDMKLRMWRPEYLQWRETQEKIAGQPENNRELEDSEDHVQYFSRTLTPATSVRTEESYMRQRWRQERYRPRRPGANALLFLPVVKQTAKTSVASLNLDNEDLEQLFLDTGFNVGGKKRIPTTT